MTKRLSKGLRAAIYEAGTKRKLAAAIGIREQSLNKWKDIPRKRIMAVHRATGVPLEILAPDLYATTSSRVR